MACVCADAGHAAGSPPGGAPGCAGPAHVAGTGEAGVWRPRHHCGGAAQGQSVDLVLGLLFFALQPRIILNVEISDRNNVNKSLLTDGMELRIKANAKGSTHLLFMQKRHQCLVMIIK